MEWKIKMKKAKKWLVQWTVNCLRLDSIAKQLDRNWLFTFIYCRRDVANLTKESFTWCYFCLATNCRPIGAPLYGSKSGSNYNAGSTISFSCDPGYSMRGSSSRTCQEGGWTGSNPRCSGMYHPLFEHDQFRHFPEIFKCLLLKVLK